MRAYKFLKRDGTTILTGFRWPAGAWVEAEGALAWCANGIHACRVQDLPHWLGQELWLVELDGQILTAPDSVVARRARLVERVDMWSGGVAQEFGESWVRRATAIASAFPAAAARARDAAGAATDGSVPAAAYLATAVIAEVAAGSRAGATYQHCFLAERSRQARWLQARMALSDG